MFNRSHVSSGRDSTPQSLFYCLSAPHIYIVVLRAHPVRGESHIQRNATGEVATPAGAYPVSKVRGGAISVIFGSQV